MDELNRKYLRPFGYYLRFRKDVTFMEWYGYF